MTLLFHTQKNIDLVKLFKYYESIIQITAKLNNTTFSFTSSKLKLNIGADIGPSYAKWISSDFGEFESTESKTFLLYGNLKIGIRF